MKHAALLLALVLAGCTAATSSPLQSPASAASAVSTPTASRLSRYHWRLTSAVDRNGQPIEALRAGPKGPLQLDFSAGRIAVKHVCNAMGAAYHISDSQLHVAPMLHTMMACADHSLMQLENAIGKRLRAPLQIDMASGAGTPQLTLTSADGDTLTFAGSRADHAQ